MYRPKQIIQTEHSAQPRHSRPSTGLSKASPPPPTQTKFLVKPIKKKQTSNCRSGSKKDGYNTCKVKVKKQSLASTVVHSRNTSRENKTKINSMIKSDDEHSVKIIKYQSKKTIIKASPAASNQKSNGNLFSLKVPVVKQSSPLI